MKKVILIFTILAVIFTGCSQPTDDSDSASSVSALTIKNESSYDLSNVTWTGISFASPNSSDLLKGTASKKETKDDNASGYIYFTRKDIGINLRTQAIWMADDSPVTINDNTVVVEVGNESNTATLSVIGLIAEIGFEHSGRAVVKNDTISGIETPVNIPKQIDFTLKNTGSGTLTLTGVTPVSVTSGAFLVTQPMASTIASGGSLPFKIIFTPLAVETYTTTVTIKSNDPAGDFTFTITANGTEPKPVITILNGTDEVPQNGTVIMGNVTLSGTVDITIKNTGIAPLTIESSGITINGTDAAAFSLVSLPDVAISAGSSSTLRIQYAPSVIGVQSAVISIPNNDPLRNSTRFTVQGTGYFPPPSSITASADSSNSITVSWNAVTGASSYTVYHGSSSDGTYIFSGTSPTTSYTNTSLSAGTAYYYKVSAHSIYGESAQSSFVSAITRPEAPTGVSAVAQSASSVQITWNSVNGAMSYTVYRAASSDGTYTFAGNSYTTSYTNTGLAANTTYYYKTSASGSGGESVQSSYASAITQIGVPTGVSAVAQSASSIQITWNSVSGASSYTVYRSGSSGGTYTSVGTSSTSLYTNTGLIGGSTFYYKISANGANGEGAQSAAYAYATTLRSVAPTGVSATSLSASSIQIAWNSVNGASSYTVYRSGSSGGTYTSVGTSSTSSYTNTGLNAGTIYYYKVSAHSTDGESYQSSSVSAITMPTVPTGVRTYTGSSSIDIYWYDVTGASYYKVYRAISATGNYQLVNTISSSLISYSDTGLSANTMYYYKVSAVNAGGESGQSAYVSARTKVASPTVAATAQSSSVIRLNWNSVSGATSYTVYQYLGSSYHVVGSLSATSVDITGLSANTSYSFVVSATGAEGEGNLSPIVSAITL